MEQWLGKIGGPRLKVSPSIPTSSTGDIAMLLMIFFMSTVIFRVEQGIPIAFPRAEAGQTVPRENSVRIWIDAGGRVSIDDNMVSVSDIEPIISRKLQRNPALIVQFNVDRRARYDLVSEAIDRLKSANALRVAFTAPRRETEEE